MIEGVEEHSSIISYFLIELIDICLFVHFICVNVFTVLFILIFYYNFILQLGIHSASFCTFLVIY